jgi:DNA-directed RNA polymerase specialized sigma24 family protein
MRTRALVGVVCVVGCAGETATMDVRRTVVTGEAWDKLLGFLDDSRESAARKYEESRRRLVKLFAWKGLPNVEDLADETFDRVARKLAAGEQIRTGEAERYIAGVARLVAFEAARAARREDRLTEDAQADWVVPEDDRFPAHPDMRHFEVAECLDECLGKLPDASRKLLLGYHVGEGGERIANRKRIAEGMGIALNALRIRVHRLRHEIETCVARCKAAAGAAAGEARRA